MKFEIGFIAVSMVFALAACGYRQKSEAFSDENGMQEQKIDGELQNSTKNDENLSNKHFDSLNGKFIDKDSAIFDEKQIIDEFYRHHTFRQKLISLASGSDEERRLFVRAMYASGQVEALSDGDRAMLASWIVDDEIKLLKSDKTQKNMPDVIDVSKWSAELNRAKDDSSRRRIWEARLSEYRQSVARARAAGDEERRRGVSCDFASGSFGEQRHGETRLFGASGVPPIFFDIGDVARLSRLLRQTRPLCFVCLGLDARSRRRLCRVDGGMLPKGAR